MGEEQHGDWSRRLPPPARAMLVRRPQGMPRPKNRRQNANDAMADRQTSEIRDWTQHSEAGRVHGTTNAEPRSGVDLRPIPRLRHHADRRRATGPQVLRHGDQSAVL